MPMQKITDHLLKLAGVVKSADVIDMAERKNIQDEKSA